MADGSIKIALDLEIKQAEKKLDKLKQDVGGLKQEDAGHGAIDKLGLALERSTNKAEDLTKTLAELNATKSAYENMLGSGNYETEQRRLGILEGINREIRDTQTNLKGEYVKIGEINGKAEQLKEKFKGVTRETDKATNSSRNLGNALGKGVSSVRRMTFALLGARSAYTILNKVTREWLNSNDVGAVQAKSQIEGITTALTSILAPALQFIANLVSTIVGYLNAFLSTFFGINILAKKTASNVGGGSKGIGGGLKKANKEAKKLTAQFDKADVATSNISDNAGGAGGGGGGGAVIAPTIGAIDTSRFTEAMDRLKKDLKPFLDMIANIDLEPLAQAFDRLKEVGAETLGILYDAFIRLMNEAIGPLIVIFMEEIAPLFLHLLADILEIINPLLERLLNEYVIPIITWFTTEIVPIAFDLIVAVVEFLATAFGIAWTAMMDFFDDIKPFTDFLANILTGAIEGLTEGFKELTDAIKDDDSALGSAFKTIGKVVGILIVIKGVALAVKGVLWLLTPVIAGVTKVFSLLWAGIKAVALFFSGIFTGSILAIIALIAVLVTALVGIITNFEQIKQDFFRIVGNIKGIFSGLVNFIAGVFTGNWSRAFKGLVQIVGNAFAGMVNLVKFPINIILDGINAMIRGLNKVKIPGWVPVVGGKGINIPQIPRLAKGGVLTRPTLNIAGEYAGARSNPEIVTPESLMRKVFNEEMGRLGNTGQAQSQTIQLVVDGKVLAEAVNDNNKQSSFSRNGDMAWNM